MISVENKIFPLCVPDFCIRTIKYFLGFFVMYVLVCKEILFIIAPNIILMICFATTVSGLERKLSQ